MDEGRGHGEVKDDESEVVIPIDGDVLKGFLEVPDGAEGIVIFAHGAGSSRLSPRNRYVSVVVRECGLGTLLFDLLTEAEAEDRENVFDIELLADRLLAATAWVEERLGARELRIGYFGASTGAGAALVAAARQPERIQGVVSRGGRPDLAGPALEEVRAPTLLLVGSEDTPVIGMNEEALERLGAETELRIIPGATHLFEEPGTLEQVAETAAEWFRSRLGAQTVRRRAA